MKPHGFIKKYPLTNATYFPISLEFTSVPMLEATFGLRDFMVMCDVEKHLL